MVWAALLPLVPAAVKGVTGQPQPDTAALRYADEVRRPESWRFGAKLSSMSAVLLVRFVL